MKKLLISLILLILALPVGAWAGTARYCDCTVNSGTGGVGTFADPFESINDANNGPGGGWQTGDDLYFLDNTTCQDSEYLTISWTGTSGDGVVVGAYKGENDFTYATARPILDGQGTVPGTSYRGMIYSYEKDYLDIKDLRINNSNYQGIYIRYADNSTVQNCYIYHSEANGILVGRGGSNTIKDNMIERAIYTNDSGAAIELSHSPNNTVQRNVIIDSDNEGIGVYFAESTGNTIEYNVVYNSDSFHIYLDGSSNNTVHYNLVYDTDGSIYGRTYGIVVDIEASIHPACTTGSNKIYGNVISGTSKGITLSCGASGSNLPNCGQTNNEIYNNTIVDCEKNFQFFEVTANWSGNLIKNNLSYTITVDDSVHASAYSPTGVTWDYNFFDDAVTGNAATNQVNGDPDLAGGASGYRALTAGSVTGPDNFALGASSDCIDVATVLSSPYNIGLHPTGTDYTASPITTATTSHGATPDIGAFVYGGGSSPPAGPCEEWYDFTGTVDAATAVGQYNTQEYVGPRWTQPSDQTLCEVDVYVRSTAGTLTSTHDYWMRVFTVDGNNDLDAVVATSTNKIDGDGLSANTWISENEGNFEFDDVALTDGTEYAFTIFPDQDGDQADKPEYDEANNWGWGMDNENNTAANQNGRYRWTHDAAIPYADQDHDAEDDMLIKIHTVTGGGPPTTLGTGSYVIATNTYTEGPTTTINTTTPVCLAYEVSEELQNIAYPEQSEAPVNKSDDSLIRNAVYYDHVQAVGGEWVVVYVYTPVAGDRDLDIKLGTVVKNDATMQDGDSNEWDGTGGDLGDIAVAMVKDANSPWEVKASGGDATTILGLETTAGYLLSGDYVVAQSSGESYTATAAGVTYRILSITDFDCDSLAITLYGTNRISNSLTNSGSATLYPYNPPRVTN